MRLKPEYTISKSIGCNAFCADRIRVAEMVCICFTDVMTVEEDELVLVTDTGTSINLSSSIG